MAADITNKIRHLTFNTHAFDFASVVKRMLNTGDLETIHQTMDTPLVTRETDQKTHWHKLFYSSMEHEFLPLYTRFVREVIRRDIGEDIVYQKIPTFRVHLPGNLAVGEFHKDSDYGHGSAERNYWVPLTRSFGTNSIWIEDKTSGSFYPQSLKYGDMLNFDGVGLLHGNKINETNITRVSFDLRAIPISEYIERDRVTINTKMPFKIGGYFERT